MHETEEAALNQLMPAAKKTESFFIGELDDQQIKTMRGQGLLIREMEEISAADIEPKLLKGIFVPSLTKSAPEDLIDLNAGSYPGYFRFEMDEPLIEEYREVLNTIGIEIVELRPVNSYIVRINSAQQYNNLYTKSFVKNLSYYSTKDTGMFVDTQSTVPTDDKELQMLTFDILLQREGDRAKVVTWLEKNNVAIAGKEGLRIRVYLLENSALVNQIASLSEVRAIEEYVPPTIHNDKARDIIGIDKINVGPPGDMFTGKDQIIGVADTGIDDTHPDLQGQLSGPPSARGRIGDYSDFNGHGTHVACSIAGTGAASGGKIKGMAPGAKIYFQSIMNAKGELTLPLQLSKLFEEAYAQGVRIHNNSWGSATASRYTVNAIEVDDYVWKQKDMLLVFSAGNDGKSLTPPSNVDLSYPDFLSIGSPATAKNVLTVGASRSSRNAGGFAGSKYGEVWPKSFPDKPFCDQQISGDPDCLAGFSSRGPCDDYRVKPDLVAPGTDIASAKSAKAPLSNYWGVHPDFPNYGIMGGTSMSAPIVSGCAAIVKQYYETVRQHSPSAALLKATLINGTRPMKGLDATMKNPYYNQGYGLISITNTIPTEANKFNLVFFDTWDKPAQFFIRTGQKMRFDFSLPTDGWIRICLCYTDYPGRSLQNNLNVLLDYNGAKKWVGNENVPALLNMLDSQNNVETIRVDDAKAGNYSVQVIASNLLKTPQDCALVITTNT